MRTSEAARYARWAARAALLLAVTVAGMFVYRSWQAQQAQKSAPPVVPPTVQQRSTVFAFSKVEGDRALFTVRASHATEFTAGSKSLLEDVWITIYGRTGQRFDNIHTGSCDYEPNTGHIFCAGEVQMDLESAEEAHQQPEQRVIHVRTARVSFDRETGQARTEEPVAFRFPYGQGRGMGLTYSTRDALIRLHRDVELTLTPLHTPLGKPSGKPPSAAEPTVLTGSGLEYHRDDRTLRLLGPVRVRQDKRELTAENLVLELDAALRARRLVANRKPQLRSAEPRGELLLAADEFIALFDANGWTERVIAQRGVNGTWKGPSGEDRLEGQRLEMELETGSSNPRLLRAAGQVKVLLLDTKAGVSRQVESDALRVDFAPAGPPGGRRVARAETLSPGSIVLTSPDTTTRIRGERLAAEFDARNRVRRLTGNSGAEVERRLAKGSPQLSRSQELWAAFDSAGDWVEMEQRGAVSLRQDERTAQAESARFVHATESVTLSGAAVVTDALTRTSADRLSIQQRTGEMRGEGNVRTSYRAAERDGVTNLAPQPAHISSDQVRANRDNGRAVYSGHARLWQGDSVIEANSIELFRNERRLEARGNALGLFPQVQGPPGTAPALAPAAGLSSGGKEPVLWRVHAASFTYWSGEGRVHLEGNAQAESRAGQIASRAMDLFFASGPGGAQELTRAVATGGASIRQELRRGIAERGEYTVADGKFVLSGGTPMLFDAVQGTTTGRQLTFFLADDKILIDSEEGSRTLTKHRVEK